MSNIPKKISKSVIGIDFSVNKPAATVLHNDTYYFYGWPYGINDTIKQIYKNAGVDIIDREDTKDKGSSVSEKMRYEIKNALYLSQVILDTLKPFINSTTLLALEGSSYGSRGDVVLQLSSYRYILMSKLSELMPLSNIYTYSPLTVKAVAKCSKKGMTKSDMIKMFISEGPDHPLRYSLSSNVEQFQTKKSKGWIVHLDDIVDSYWILETLRQKEML